MRRPEFLPLTTFSRIAEASDAAMSSRATERNVVLWFCIHLPIATLPKPKLARRRVTCQQKANIVADMMAAMLLMNLNMALFMPFFYCLTLPFSRRRACLPALSSASSSTLSP